MKREVRRWRRIRLRALRWAVPPLLALACLLGSGLYLSYRKDRDWNQDEAITFLESTCHLRDYRLLLAGAKPPYGTWAEARDWQQFIQSEGELCLGQIRSDLAEGDIHPPLYYWLLHLWLLGNGGDRRFMATIGLNLVLAAVAAVALYKLGRTLFASRLDGVVIAFCALLNPIAAYTVSQFRPYALLGTVTALYLLALARALRPAPTNRRTALRGAALSLATCAGLLTHHMFAAVLLGGALYAVARLAREPRGLLRVFGFSVAGVVLALALFPLISQVASNGWAIEPEQARFALRERRMVVAFSALQPKFEARDAIVAVAVGLIVLLLGIAWNDWPRGGFRRARGMHVVLFVLAVPSAIALQYSFGFSPTHAMTPKYLASMWPVVGLFAVLAFRLFGRHRFAIATGCCALLVVSTLSRVDRRWEQLFADARIMKDHPRLVIDDVSRAHLPMILARIKPESQVFVADQERLLASNGWQPAEDFTFVTCVRDRLSRRLSSQLMSGFTQTHDARRGRGWDSCWFAQPFQRKR